MCAMFNADAELASKVAVTTGKPVLAADAAPTLELLFGVVALTLADPLAPTLGA